MDRATIANGNEPSAKQLPESDIADMEYFILQLMVALPTVGFDFLREKPGVGKLTQVASQQNSGVFRNEVQLVLESRRHGVFASGVEADGEIIVMAGASGTIKNFATNTYAARRQELIDTGTLILNATLDGYVLTKDTSFRSPSEAASVLLNRNSNGRTEWRLSGSDVTLKSWQDAQLDEIRPNN